MKPLSSLPCQVRPNTGVRKIGDALCLINQERKEAWLCEGVSSVIWSHLTAGRGPEEIVAQMTTRYAAAPPETVRRDTIRFIEQLWEREIIDIPGRQDIPFEQCAGTVAAPAHNKTGRLETKARIAEVICTCVMDILVPCNLRCRHCYVDFSRRDILSFSQVCDYLDQLARHGCPEVSLSGGEVCLRRDLVDLVAYALSQGFLLNVLTNGTLMTPELAKRLGEHCLQSVQLSLYGVTAEVHEQITRKPGSFAKTIRGAKLLIDSGAPVKFLFFIQRDNVEDGLRAREFAAAMGAQCGFDSKLVANRDGSAELLKYGVTPAQQAELYLSGLREPELNFACSAAAATARITADGEIYPCALINSRSLGNLNTRSLDEIWSSPRRQALREEILNYAPGHCSGCRISPLCPPCAAMKGFDQEQSTAQTRRPQEQACLLAAANHRYRASNRVEAADGGTGAFPEIAFTKSQQKPKTVRR